MTGHRHIVATLVAMLSMGAPYCAIADDAADSHKAPGPKGLFFAQLKQPSENLNTGLRYWIELTRHGKTEHVSNKYQFRTGDQIRFHVRPNIDGFAYIVMRSGSRGEQAVLFPDAARGDNNKVDRGEDYVLPADGAFEFDANPGMEKLTLLLSRQSINASAYLAKPESHPVVIASAMSGSKDLVPSQVFVAYADPHETKPERTKVETSKPAKERIVASNPEDQKGDKNPKRKKPTPTPHITTPPVKPTPRISTGHDDAGVTTIVKKTDGVLHVNVDLDHRS